MRLRSTIRFHTAPSLQGAPPPPGAAHQLPPVTCAIAVGEDNVTIKVADEAGGIRRSRLGEVWSYRGAETSGIGASAGHTHLTHTLPHWTSLDFTHLTRPCFGRALGGSASVSARRSALTTRRALSRTGLPLARLYANYFGGTLHVAPMEGYGTDAYLVLNRLPGASSEDVSELILGARQPAPHQQEVPNLAPATSPSISLAS